MVGLLLLAALLSSPVHGQTAERAVDSLTIYLRKATGNLKVHTRASCDTYQIYFHVPIPFHEQAPVLLQVTCPQMVAYRFVREDPPNMLVAARLVNADSARLDWTSWVIIKQNRYPNLPAYVPIPAREELPDSVRQWLDATDCCQVSAPIVQSKADSIRDTTTNLMKVANDVCRFCRRIPGWLPHEPWAFDAVYALKWGNSCTGHAHAAAALLRACGIPARTLLNMPAWAKDFDMHWIIDYYVPGYGWVRMEPSLFTNPIEPQDEMVIRAANAGDEFPVWTPCAIDAEWHSSDTAFGMWDPDWGLAHSGFAVLAMLDSRERVDYAIALTDSVYGFYASYWGVGLSPAESAAFGAALMHQATALECIQSREMTGYIAEMQAALADYEAVHLAPVETLYSERFEDGPAGWTHGGGQDEWELGVPSYGPVSAHSGRNCWGTNLDGPYANNEDCWLESPPVDLSSLACADLSFWIWNSVQDVYGFVYDPVWVEVSCDGETFRPLSSRMGGVNDDPEITAVGGWSRVFLDLSQYLGNTVRFRFRFRSDGNTVFAGSYIDDVQVIGRRIRLPSIARGVLLQPSAIGSERQPSSLLDISGRKVMTLGPGANDVSRLAAGVYFVREGTQATANKPITVRKVVIVK